VESHRSKGHILDLDSHNVYSAHQFPDTSSIIAQYRAFLGGHVYGWYGSRAITKYSLEESSCLPIAKKPYGTLCLISDMQHSLRLATMLITTPIKLAPSGQNLSRSSFSHPSWPVMWVHPFPYMFPIPSSCTNWVHVGKKMCTIGTWWWNGCTHHRSWDTIILNLNYPSLVSFV